jgi:hypothetical protein
MRICPDLYEAALAEPEILIAKHTPADSVATYLNSLSWPNAPLSKTNKQFQAILPNRCRLMQLVAESCEVVKRFETWKEEIGAAFYGRESGQALYLSPDWPLRNSYVVAAVLSTDHRIAFVA